MSANGERPRRAGEPTQYVCPSCRLHLLSWSPHAESIEMYHKVALWSDFWTGEIRLICQYCLGATEVLPARLVELLRRRYGLYAPISSSSTSPRP